MYSPPMGIILWLSALALVGVVAWLVVQGVTDWTYGVAEQADHEAFWGDGATADGTWATTLRGTFGPAVEQTGNPVPSEKAKHDIRPVDKLGRRIPPERVKARPWRRRAKAGTRLPGSEALHEPENAAPGGVR